MKEIIDWVFYDEETPPCPLRHGDIICYDGILVYYQYKSLYYMRDGYINYSYSKNDLERNYTDTRLSFKGCIVTHVKQYNNKWIFKTDKHFYWIEYNKNNITKISRLKKIFYDIKKYFRYLGYIFF